MDSTQEMVQINLCRALKLKNRLASRLSRLDQLLVQHNSSVKDHSEYDAKRLYSQRMILSEKLVGLKLEISKANMQVQQQIYEIAECKALCRTLNEVNTSHGPHSVGYGEPVQYFEAQFRKPDIQKEIRKVEREIDRIQDELDSYNYTTKISIPEDWIKQSEEDL